MWWDDIAEVKKRVAALADRLERVDLRVQRIIRQEQEQLELCVSCYWGIEKLKEILCQLFYDDDSAIDEIQGKLDLLLESDRRAQKSSEDRIASMISELEQCISMARASISKHQNL